MTTYKYFQTYLPGENILFADMEAQSLPLPTERRSRIRNVIFI